MAAPLPSSDCERARALVSAWLDGELSELGRARLDAHVAECDACREYRRAAQHTTRLLRSAPLEELRVPILLPRPRHRLARIAQTGSAAAAAAAVAVIALTGTFERHPAQQPPVVQKTQPTRVQAPNLDFQLLRNAALAKVGRAHVTARLAQ
jgi:predicted anti-sigma-YlaC factor YlaD